MTPVDAMFASICSGILQLVQRVVAQLRKSSRDAEDASGAGFAKRRHVEFQIMPSELHYPQVSSARLKWPPLCWGRRDVADRAAVNPDSQE